MDNCLSHTREGFVWEIHGKDWLLESREVFITRYPPQFLELRVHQNISKAVLASDRLNVKLSAFFA